MLNKCWGLACVHAVSASSSISTVNPQGVASLCALTDLPRYPSTHIYNRVLSLSAREAPPVRREVYFFEFKKKKKK